MAADSTAASAVPGWFMAVKPFVFGGAAGMFATSCIQPIDMVKVRIQLTGESAAAGGSASANQSKNPVVVFRSILAEGGVPQLYKGLSAALLRQATYTTARMGLFRKFSDYAKDEEGKVSLGRKALASLAAGALGAVVGTPADVALVRMQADATLAEADRRGYTGVGNALTTMLKQEGIGAWFQGVSPTVARAMALNLGMLATYDHAKETVEPIFGAGTWGTRLSSSAVAGFFAAFFTLPFDFVKTRVQKQKKNAQGVYPYKNMADCALQTLKNEGALSFYKGFPTFYFRIAPHAMITLLTSDFLNKKFMAYAGASAAADDK